jgi:adenosine kinase
MELVLTGSVAYDYLMTFPGRFRDHILPDQLDRISLSFLVDSMVKQKGGIAANIAYTLGLLGEHPTIMATVGEDFEDYRLWLNSHGVDTSGIKIIPGLFTASFFVSTDEMNAQIASFYGGAMAKANELHFTDLEIKPNLAVISPTDPEAMVQYVKECRQLEIPYFYDPSQQIVRLEARDLLEGIEGCRALFANDYELGLIVEKTGLDLETISQYAQFIIITRGEHGADFYTGDDFLTISAIPPKEMVDPTGVGDAFRGGFLKGYLHELPLERCGQMGVLAATYCLEKQGTQAHHFDLPTFIERFREHFDDEGELDQLA